MKRHKILLLVLLAVFLVGSNSVAFCETINPANYWLLEDGYTSSFSWGRTLTISQTASDGETFFDVNLLGTGCWRQSHDASGNLLMYGATMSEGGHFDVLDPQETILFPAEMEIEKTYRTRWQRYEYDMYNQYHAMGNSSVEVFINRAETIQVPAGIFTVYKFEITENWVDSWEKSGTSRSAFWLADDVGCVRVERDGVIYDLQSYEKKGRPPAVPRLSVKTTGTSVMLDWSNSADADGFTFFYAPYPYQGPQTIGTIDMGAQTTASFGLFSGAEFYVAVEAYNTYGGSGLSDIKYFYIPYDLTVSPESLSVFPGQSNTCTLNGGIGPYGVRSDNTAVATVSLSGGTVTVTGVAEGSATITFFDSGGASGTFPVSVTGDSVYDWAADMEIALINADMNLLYKRYSKDYLNDGEDLNCLFSIFEYTFSTASYLSASYDIKSIKDVSQDSEKIKIVDVEEYRKKSYFDGSDNFEITYQTQYVLKLEDGKWKDYGNQESYIDTYLRDIKTCTAVNNGVPQNIKSSFDLNDGNVYLWFRIDGLRKGTKIVHKWYKPNGTLYWAYDWGTEWTNSLPECGAYFFTFWPSLKIDGYETWWAENSGTWKILIFINDQFAGRVYYEYRK